MCHIMRLPSEGSPEIPRVCQSDPFHLGLPACGRLWAVFGCDSSWPVSLQESSGGGVVSAILYHEGWSGESGGRVSGLIVLWFFVISTRVFRTMEW